MRVLSARRVLAPRSEGASEVVGRFLSDLALELADRGCTMVGHIKGMAAEGGKPALFFSLTSLGAEPHLRGGPLQDGQALALSITLIVAGLAEREMGQALNAALAKHFDTGVMGVAD